MIAIILTAHFLGMAILTIIHFVNGTYKNSLNGDGFRTPRPSDILFSDFVWEFFILPKILLAVDEIIDKAVAKIYKNAKWFKF